jgi:hypothetical protein
VKPLTYTPPPGSPEENDRFHQLQAKLRDQFLAFRADPTRPYTAVIVPSQSVDPVELAKIDGVQHYEERSLFNLMLLRRPRMRLIYVTSKRLNPLVVDYYLHQMRGVPSAHARRRLTLFDCDDASPRPLTLKVLERPRLLERIAQAIDDTESAHMVVFNATPLERTLSVQLDIALNACDPDLIHLGNKTGSRRIFRETGVPLPPGREDLRDTQDLTEALVELWSEAPDAERAVVKLNDSFSGEGNAILALDRLDAGGASPAAAARAAAIQAALPAMEFEAAGQTWEGYREQFDGMGGVCELWIPGENKSSPSVQLRVNPLREVQVVSTHDQVLGGPTGQADPLARARIQALGKSVGERLAAQGVIGRFGVDFVVVPDPAGADPQVYALEINLRQGGTTHPFNTLKFLTDGLYDEPSGTFTTTQGQPRAYFCTDTLQAPEYCGILPFDLFDLLVHEGILFRADETGVVFHLLGCLSQFGKLGCTAIAPTVPEALALYASVVRLLDRHSGRTPD